ncbi:MAG: winged helix-turn-helix domain-containing protein [Methanomicrobiales archaeon]|nr:winged helix-turn-helix domain-containing protein [Methanomicrobiales archaeon]
MVEGVVILEPGDERAKKIAKAMASGTATGILNLLKEGKRTATEVAEQLQIPMTTVQYHLENLREAGLIEVAERRWSVKGREVKVYGLRDQVLIVTPKRGDLKGLLLKYASLFTLVMFAGIMAAILAPMLGIGAVPGISPDGVAGAGDGFARTNHDKQLTEGAPAAIPEMTPNVSAPAAAPPIATPGFNWIPLLVFFGGVVVLLVLMGNEIVRWYRER